MKVEKQDPTSFHSLYKGLIHIRKSSRALTHGDINVTSINDSKVLTYTRSDVSDSYTVLINFSKSKQPVSLKNKGVVLMSSLSGQPSKHEVIDHLNLAAYEAVLIRN